MSNDFRTEKNPVTTICKLGLGFYFGKLLEKWLLFRYFFEYAHWYNSDSSESDDFRSLTRELSSPDLDRMVHWGGNLSEGVF